jgi:ABC-type sugar transport system ATPase subunit/ribose/xylose/arabinose/galactoside ABC-type transport system permease subunit
LKTLDDQTPIPTVETTAVFVRVGGVSKAFGGVHALVDVNLEILPGEIHALCGENGAGKSTLIKILGGIYAPDNGKVLIAGRELLPSVAAATELGVGVIHQESVVCPHLNAVDNIFIGRELHGPLRFLLDWSEMTAQSQHLLNELGESIDLSVPVGALSVAQRQLIGMARALSQNSRLLILDEPTASLSAQEVEALFRIIRKLRQHGVSILYVSHRMEEIFALSDRVSVLRDGRHVRTLPRAGLTVEALVELMVGREVEPLKRDGLPNSQANETVLAVDGLTCEGEFYDINFNIRAGEIVGLAGLVGAGRSEVANAIFGVTRYDSGSVTVAGEPLKPGSISTSVEKGIAFVPEDRQHLGLILQMTVSENLSMAVLRSLSSKGMINRRVERELVQRLTAELLIRTARTSLPAEALSGGNQQKIALGKWLATNPRLLILDEPTRGVDIAAKAEIHRHIREIVGHGVAVLLISSELPEILTLSDRILVMRQGSISAEFSHEQATEQKILSASLPKADHDPDKQAVGVVNGVKALSVFRRREAWIAVLIAFTVGYVGLHKPSFLDLGNLIDVAAEASPIAILACAMTLVIVTGEIDISIGSIIGLSGAILGIACYGPEPPMSVSMGVISALATATAIGAINGILITWGRVPSIIATLGMLTALRGLTKLVMQGSSVDGRPESLRILATDRMLGIPFSVWVACLVACVLAFVMGWTRLGRRIFAVGSNQKAAPLLGVSVKRTKLVVFTLSGFMAGLATLLIAPKNSIIQPNLGEGLELLVITCVVVGGTSIAGGRGTLIGTILAVALLVLLPTALTFIGAPTEWRMAIQGAFILVAVLLDQLSSDSYLRRAIA